jgi:hypothetical protein
MKNLLYIALALALLTGLTVSMAWSQEDVYLLNTEELGDHTRPFVRFNHALHVEKMEDACIGCHHDYNENLGISDSDGARCADCHTPEATEDNRINLEDAYHIRCKDCHQSLFDKGNVGIPIMCGQCHKRGVEAPAE